MKSTKTYLLEVHVSKCSININEPGNVGLLLRAGTLFPKEKAKAKSKLLIWNQSSKGSSISTLASSWTSTKVQSKLKEYHFVNSVHINT